MRFLVPVTVAVLAATLSPALADQKAECQMQADIMTRVVELRREGTRKVKALRILTSGEDDAVAEKYLPSVPHIVEWVYEDVERKDLQKDFGAAYFEQCMSL